MNVIVEVKYEGKLNPIVDFLSFHGEIIEGEPLKDDVQEGRHFDESSSSGSFGFFVANTAVIKVVLIENLWFEIALNSQFEFLVVDLFVDVFDSNYDILEEFLPYWFVLAFLAFGIMN